MSKVPENKVLVNCAEGPLDIARRRSVAGDAPLRVPGLLDPTEHPARRKSRSLSQPVRHNNDEVLIDPANGVWAKVWDPQDVLDIPKIGKPPSDDDEDSLDEFGSIPASVEEEHQGPVFCPRRNSKMSESNELRDSAPSRRGSACSQSSMVSVRSSSRHGTAPTGNMSAHLVSLTMQASKQRAQGLGKSPSFDALNGSRRPSVVMQIPNVPDGAAQKRLDDRRTSHNSVTSSTSYANMASNMVFGGLTEEEAKTGLELWDFWKEDQANLARKLSVLSRCSVLGGAGGKTNMWTGGGTPRSMRKKEGPSRSDKPRKLTSEKTWNEMKTTSSLVKERVRRFSPVIHPNSGFKMMWDIAGMTLMGYDLINIPLSSFEPAPNFFTDMMVWITLLYWTVDMPCSFITGYSMGGLVELHMRKIIPRYVRTWFPFDLTVLGIDWVLTMFDEVGKGQSDTGDLGYVKMGRTARVVRMLRLLRLLRLLKVQGKLSEVLQAIQSENTKILLGIVKLVVAIMVANHIIACGWYMLGSSIDEANTWVRYNGLYERDIGYRYTTSLHWSLTQFTPASMEISARNTAERIYTVTVLMFAMVTFSSFISSITNATTQLRKLDAEDTDRRNMLFKYLKQHEISTVLGTEVWTWVLSAKDKKHHRLHEKEVFVLNLLPKSLRTQLRDQVYGAQVRHHPLFKRMCETSPSGASKLYQYAMSEVAVGMGQELFMVGEVADRMYFLVAGEMRYWQEESFELEKITSSSSNRSSLARSGSKDSGDIVGRVRSDGRRLSESSTDSPVDEYLKSQESKKSLMNLLSNGRQKTSETLQTIETIEMHKGAKVVSTGMWLSEAVLWVKWKHSGTCAANVHSELFGMSSEKFIQLVKTENTEFQEVCLYARYFVKHIMSHEIELTDIWSEREAINKMTAEAFDDYLGYERQFLSAMMERPEEEEDEDNYDSPSQSFPLNCNGVLRTSQSLIPSDSSSTSFTTGFKQTSTL